MFELALILGLIAALFLFALFFKALLAILIWPIKAVFWLLGGLLQLVLLPFQLIGGILFAILVLPLILLGVGVAITVGVPVLLVVAVALAIAIVGAVLAALGGLFFGGC